MSRNDFGPTDYLCYEGERKLQIEEVIKYYSGFCFIKMTLSSAVSSLELFCKSTLLRENYMVMFLLIRMYIGIDLLNC